MDLKNATQKKNIDLAAVDNLFFLNPTHKYRLRRGRKSHFWQSKTQISLGTRLKIIVFGDLKHKYRFRRGRKS